MKSLKIVKAVIGFLFLFQLLNSCKKSSINNNPPPPVTSVTITSVEPDSGKHGDTIMIAGTHFNLTPSMDTVKFNSKMAIVQKATADTLLVLVPLGAGSGAITVNRSTAPGPAFIYIPVVMVSTLAGGAGGYLNGPDSLARFSDPDAICFDLQGNMYVDDGDYRIRKISGGMVSAFAGDGASGYINGPDSIAEFWFATGLAADAQGNIYVADEEAHRLRKISAGLVSTYAGTGVIGNLNGPVATAQFYSPLSLAFDAQGDLYVVESNDVRKISPSGVVSSFAGGGVLGVGGFMDGPDTTARFNNPIGIAVDTQGNVYVTDNINRRVRKITSAGLVSTLAGTGVQGFKDGPADSAQFYLLSGVAVDIQGNIYVSDWHCIRKITPGGVVSLFAGTYTPGFADGPASVAKFDFPTGLAFDTSGNLYVADANNTRIRKITFE
jgi:sugar lactone lactonase YvrE